MAFAVYCCHSVVPIKLLDDLCRRPRPMRPNSCVIRWAVTLIACCMFVFVISLPAQQPADVILHSGKIVTVDNNFSIAQAVAISGRQFAAVGQNADVLKLAGPDTLVIDLK